MRIFLTFEQLSSFRVHKRRFSPCHTTTHKVLSLSCYVPYEYLGSFTMWKCEFSPFCSATSKDISLSCYVLYDLLSSFRACWFFYPLNFPNPNFGTQQLSSFRACKREFSPCRVATWKTYKLLCSELMPHDTNDFLNIITFLHTFSNIEINIFKTFFTNKNTSDYTHSIFYNTKSWENNLCRKNWHIKILHSYAEIN